MDIPRLIALTRDVSPGIVRCELTFLPRTEIDFAKASEQHRAYRDALAALGVEVVHLDDGASFPDGTFVEDLAVVLDETALVTRPGAASREKETETFARVLSRYRKLSYVTAPAPLEGGDVLRIGRRIFVGLSTRTNREGAERLRRLAEPHGYSVQTVEMKGCLHL